MKKEEILEASRKENKQKDFAEIEVEKKAVKIGAYGIVILATIYFCMEIFIKGETNYGWYSIISLYCAILYGYKAVHDKKALHIFCGIIWAIVAVICTTQCILKIFETSTIL